MRFRRGFASHGGERLEILVRDEVVDAQECARRPPARHISGFRPGPIDRKLGQDGLDVGALFDDPPAGAIHDASSVLLRAPFRPSTILCAGSNYRARTSSKKPIFPVGKEAGVFRRRSRRLRDRTGRRHRLGPEAHREARLRNRARHRHRQAGHHIPVNRP